MTRPTAALCAAGLVACSFACSVSCSSAEITGGAVVAPGAGPSTSPLGTWTTADCRDAFQRPFAFAESTVRLFRGIDGRLLVVESRAGYDDVIVANSFVPKHLPEHLPEPGAEHPSTSGPVAVPEHATENVRLFQVSVKPASGPRILREYRVPETGDGPGRFTIVSDVLDWNDPEGQAFRASYRVAAIACDLVQAPRGATAPLAASATPAAIPAAKEDGGAERDAMVPPP